MTHSMLSSARMHQAMVALTLACFTLTSLGGDSKPATKSSAKKSPAKAKAKAPASLAEELTRLIARPELKGAAAGIHILRLRDGKTLYQHQVDRSFIPASNAKLFTTAAALHSLGPEFQFRTIIGTTDRDLVIVGGGDPTIGGRFAEGDPTVYFRRWAGLLKQQRLTNFPGDLVLDDSLFDRQFVHPNWPKGDIGHWYAAPIAALVLNDSCVDVRVEPGGLAGPAKVTMTPDTRYFELVNKTRTVASSKEHAPRVLGGPGHKKIECDGGVYQRASPITNWVPVDDPVLYFGTVLKDVLGQEGITVHGRVRRGTARGDGSRFQARFVHRFDLLPVLSVTNKESQNLYAEQLFKTLGTLRGQGSWNTGREAVREALEQLGIDTAGLVLDDGCGLSRSNRATPRAFTSLLAAMHRGSYGSSFRQTLSEAGKDGTLRKRLTNQNCQGRVWAKTGSITGVRSISGYVQNRAGDWLAFSFLVNNVRVSIRALQDDFLRVLIESDAAGNLVRRDPQ